MPVVTMAEITEFCQKIKLSFSLLTLKVLVGGGGQNDPLDKGKVLPQRIYKSHYDNGAPAMFTS